VDDGVEPKSAIIEASVDVKPTVEVKVNVKIPFQAYIEEKPKPTDVAKLRDYEVNTASFFLTKNRWRERDDLLGWIRRQAARAGFTISIDKLSIKNSMVTLQYERSGVYKPLKRRKKLNFEGTSSRKCDCPFRLRGYFEKNTNDWSLAMLNGIHNHELEPKLGVHLLAGKIKEEEKKRVFDMTKSLTLPRNILTDLKKKNKESVTNIKQVYNALTRWRKGIKGDKTEM